ncbi:MAG: acyltransferase, partial [Roseobacter sp.]|nr:acyltransferase [Roseobacter sp.]
MGSAGSNTTRDISYAFSAETKGGRALIRLMENSTGRLRLIKRAQGYEDEVASGRQFFSVMVERYGISLDVVHGALTNVPST